ncbi:ribosomal protein L28 [Williamsia sp. R60]
MSMHCQVTGRKPGFGKQVSHSHVRTNRRWNPNIQRRRYFLPSEHRTVTLTRVRQRHQDHRSNRNRGGSRPDPSTRRTNLNGTQ